MGWHEVVLFAAALLAGAVNSVAGGGTLLTFPALLWTLQSEILANATSTVALWPGALSSLWGYRAEFRSSWREIAALAAPSLLGGLLGAVLLVRTQQATFAAIVPYLILLATLLFIAQGPLARWLASRPEAAGGDLAADQLAPPRPMPEAPQSGRQGRWYAVLAFQLGVGVYGGYFGAGIGILMLAAFGFLGFTNIHHMNALKNLNGLCINGIAAGLFVYRGFVDWRLALLMAAGAIVGGYGGAGLARRVGQLAVRRMVIAIGLALTVWLLVRQLGAG